MSEHNQAGDKEIERRESDEVVVAEVDISNPIKPEDNAENTKTESLGETIESGENKLSEELLLQESLAEAHDADYIDEPQKVSFGGPSPMVQGSFDDFTGLDQAARYARPSEGDRLIAEESDDPAFAAEQDRADNEYDDEQGVYAMPLTPDSSIDQEHPAERTASDVPDVAVEDPGTICPGVPPPPDLFLEQERDELRTPPVEATLPNVLVSYNRVKYESLIL